MSILYCFKSFRMLISIGAGSMPTIVPGSFERPVGQALNHGCCFIYEIVILFSGSVVKILEIISVASGEIKLGT
jgi:hypothetical protein